MLTRKKRIRKANALLALSWFVLLSSAGLLLYGRVVDAYLRDESHRTDPIDLKRPDVQVYVNNASFIESFMSISGGAGLILGFRLRTRSRKLRAPNVSEICEEDFRPPVLYVRSFNDDRRLREKKRGTWLLWMFGLSIREAERYEVVLSRTIDLVGPMIGIGRPMEGLPELGAARAYVADVEWKDALLKMHRRSSIVVLQAGLSTGLRWEIEQIFSPDTFKPVLVCFPALSPDGPPPEGRLRVFRNVLQSIGSFDLPPALGHSYLIWFGSARRGELVPSIPRYLFDDGGFAVLRERQYLLREFSQLWPMVEPLFPGISERASTLWKRRRTMRVLKLVAYVTVPVILALLIGYRNN